MPPTQAEWDEMWDVVHELQEKVAWNEKAIETITVQITEFAKAVKELL